MSVVTSWALTEALLNETGSAEPEPRVRRGLPAALRAKLDQYERRQQEIGPVGSLRRGRLLAWDEQGGVWEGVDLETGRRVQLFADGRTGHSLGAVDITLADTLPAEDLEPVEIARIILGVLTAARRAHVANKTLGAVSPDLVTWDGAWHATVTGLVSTPEEDLRAIGALAFSLDPEDETGLGAALSGGPEDADGACARALATALTALRHGVARRELGRRREDGRSRLRRIILRLQKAMPLPGGEGQVGPRHRLRSDGRCIWAGPKAETLIYDGRMDGVIVRALLRAWATGGADEGAVPVLRWMRGMTRLRVDARLLDR